MRQSGRHPYETRFSDFEKKGKKSSQYHDGTFSSWNCASTLTLPLNSLWNYR
jgi:hypothetical protein